MSVVSACNIIKCCQVSHLQSGKYWWECQNIILILFICASQYICTEIIYNLSIYYMSVQQLIIFQIVYFSLVSCIYLPACKWLWLVSFWTFGCLPDTLWFCLPPLTAYLLSNYSISCFLTSKACFCTTTPTCWGCGFYSTVTVIPKFQRSKICMFRGQSNAVK